MGDLIQHIMIIALLIIAGLLFVGALVMIPFSIKQHCKLKEQCLADGHKEYECESLLNGGRGSLTVGPIRLH